MAAPAKKKSVSALKLATQVSVALRFSDRDDAVRMTFEKDALLKDCVDQLMGGAAWENIEIRFPAPLSTNHRDYVRWCDV